MSPLSISFLRYIKREGMPTSLQSWREYKSIFIYISYVLKKQIFFLISSISLYQWVLKNVVPRPTASPPRLLEFSSHLRTSESETLGNGSSNLHVNKWPQWRVHAQVWERLLYTEDRKKTMKLITIEQQFSKFLVSGPSQKKLLKNPKSFCLYGYSYRYL